MNGPDFALFNDEAHNSPAPEYEATLRRMREKVVLRDGHDGHARPRRRQRRPTAR